MGPDETLSTPRTGRILIVALAAAGIAAGLLGGVWWWRSYLKSPQAAVSTIARATMRGDVEGVSAHIDTTSVADQAVDDLLGTQGTERVSAFLGRNPGDSSDELKVAARSLLAQEIREHVESGTLPRRIPIEAESLKALAASVYARHAVRSVRVDGDRAHVIVEVPFERMTVKVEVEMRRSEETWRVTRIENLLSVMRQLGY